MVLDELVERFLVQKCLIEELVRMVLVEGLSKVLVRRACSKNVEALKNVTEDEPHFFTEIVDNYLRGSITGRGGGWLAKHSIVSNDGHGGGGLLVLGGKSSRESKNGYGDVGGVVEKSKVVELTWEWSIVCLVRFMVDGGAVW
ncbi:hypothetical protein Tco_0408305 [Tanacetum coccineum]